MLSSVTWCEKQGKSLVTTHQPGTGLASTQQGQFCAFYTCSIWWYEHLLLGWVFPKFCPKPAQVDCEISSQLLATRSSAELDMDMQCEIFFRLKRTCFALQSGQPNIPNSCTAKKKWRSLVLSTYYRDVGGMGHQPIPTSRGTGLATVTVLEPRAPQHGPKCRAFSLLSRLRCDLGSLSARPFHLGKPTMRKVNPN